MLCIENYRDLKWKTMCYASKTIEISNEEKNFTYYYLLPACPKFNIDGWSGNVLGGIVSHYDIARSSIYVHSFYSKDFLKQIEIKTYSVTLFEVRDPPMGPH